MKKYILLIFVLVSGFAGSDIRKESVVIEWRNITVDEGDIYYSGMLTFDQAAYPDEGSLVPVYFRIFENKGAEIFQFVIENPQFEEIQLPENFPGIEKISEEIRVINKTSVARGVKNTFLQVPTLKKSGDKYFKLKSFELSRISRTEGIVKSAKKPIEWKANSVLQQGKWVKISVSQKGIYKIPYSKLISWGFADPSKVSVFGSGGRILSEDPGDIGYDDLVQCNTWTDKNGGSDCLFFYAAGTTEWTYNKTKGIFEHKINDYSSKGYFFLTDNAGTKTISKLPVISDQPIETISSANAYQLYESDLENVLPLGSGKKWYGEKFKNSSVKNIDLELTDIDTSETVSFQVNGIARSYNSSEMKFLVNQVETGSLKFTPVNTASQTSAYADEKQKLFNTKLKSNSVKTVLKYYADNINNNSDGNAIAWLDFVEVNYFRKLKFSSSPLFFRDVQNLSETAIVAFRIENATSNSKIIDVTDNFNLYEVPTEVNGGIATFKRTGSTMSEYVAFNPDGTFAEPELVDDVANQNLHAMSVPEFVIVSHPAFLSSANRLADFHRSYDGMSVEVVTTEQVYNEFSSGERNATGIRNFFKMLYDKDTKFKYALLFGDGSFDNRGIRAETKNFVPTYQSFNSLDPVGSFVTDDYFAILDAGESVYDGSLDIGVGRISCSTSYEAAIVVDKIEQYYSSEALGNWRNSVCFIADDEDGNLHVSDTEKLANMVNADHGEFITDKIYLDAYQQIVTAGEEKYPDVTAAINEKVKNGVLILNYTGHANERYMADEHVLDISNVNSWSNKSNLPIFVTATCEFSRFDADDNSIGEYVLFNANGGGIGLFSTTRLVYAYSNFLLNQSFYKFVFEADKNGVRYRMGDIMRLAKNNTLNTINKRNFSLLADPALRLSYPKHKVVTTKINNNETGNGSDTLKALEKVTIEGHISDFSGAVINNFNGKMAVTVYDKETIAKTLGNNGETPFSYKVHENIIYKGTVSVSNGKFNVSFVIPKDISYKIGKGKIMYYADNGTDDAHGAYDDFMIGGLSDQAVNDNKGPDINLYMDSKEFVNGGQTSRNPVLLAYLSDDNGINTTGTGIGHDITAIIDDDYSNVIVLNSYYQADKDDFTSGLVSFPMKNLEPGKHKLTLKAWDVANNSSETEIEFEVTGDFYISSVLNRPNPANQYTYFSFSHNQADAKLDVMIEIFNLAGTRVDYIVTEVGSDGLNSNPVYWNFGESATALTNGIYIYRITARNNYDDITASSGKLIIVR